MLLILILIAFLALADGREIQYSMGEQNDPDHVLGNITKDANIQDFVRSQDVISDIRYSILTTGNQKASLFAVDSETSILKTVQTLDRDELCKYMEQCVLKFDVVAQSSTSDFFKKISIVVTLYDINDNTPSFPVPVVNLTYLENSVVGTNQPLAGATDVDAGNNSALDYKVEPEDAPFVVHAEYFRDGRSTLRLAVSKSLDREKTDKYHIKVLAKDRGNPVRTGSVIVDIGILDVNEQPPRFENETYRVSIAEDLPRNSMIFRLKATDSDLGENGRVIYRLSQRQTEEIQKMFAINPTSGELSIVTSLMNKGGQDYKVIVVASDNASTPMISKAQVLVTVLDTHNTAPVIQVQQLLKQKNSNFTQIAENLKNGTVIAIIDVTDTDKGLNGQVECYLNDTDFQLLKYDATDFNMVVHGKLNREFSEWKKVQIICKDKGTPPLNAYDVLTIQLVDVNDNDPYFTQDIYQISVYENTKLGTSIFAVSAEDKDVSPSIISYFMNSSIDDSSKFVIDKHSGVIYVNGSLDRETTSFFSLPLIASDNHLPVHTGSAVLEISILDRNDNAPHFLPGNFVFKVLENEPPNVLVGTILANDLDEGKNSELSISGINMAAMPFHVYKNGSIYTKSSLDREIKSKYSILVVAKDGGVPPMSSFTNVTIKVQDDNDNTPKVIVPEVLRVSQYTLPNTVLLHVNATDDDADVNSQLLFDIEDHDNVTNILAISRFQGQLTLVRSLTSDDLGQYKCVIIVKDMGNSPRTSSVSLTVFINQDDISTQRHASEESIKYYAIAVAICCVTIVLSAVIILVICLIRRKDRLEVDKTNSSITSQVTQESDLSQIDMRLNGVYNSNDYIQGTLTKSCSERKKEKQVTFMPYIAPQIKYQEEDSDTQPEVISEDVTIWDWEEHGYTHAYRPEDQYSPDELPNLYGANQKNYPDSNLMSMI